jgi:hypothetical protein
LGGAVCAIVGAVVVWFAAVWIMDDGVLGAQQWQRLDRAEAAVHGVWVVLVIVSIVPLAVVAAFAIGRALRTGAAVTAHLLTVRTVFSTTRVPVSDIAEVKHPPIPAQCSGPSAVMAPPERSLEVVALDGARMRLGWLARARRRDGVPPLGVLLDRVVGSARVPAPPERVATSSVTRARGFRRTTWVMTALLLASAGALYIAVDWHLEHVAEERRTAQADASVLGVEFVDGDASDEPRSDIRIAFETSGATVKGEVSKPGRSGLQVEDVVTVVYDPNDVRNVELAARPPIDAAGYRILLATALSVFLMSCAALAFLGIRSAWVTATSARRAGCA